MTANADSVIHDHSRSFSLATRLLPNSIAPDVRKLYAWCRYCDNAVDEAESPRVAAVRIADLKADVHRIYAGESTKRPESDWLKEIVQRYDFPIKWPLDLLDGMESDVDFRPLENVADLERYCYLAAGVVGLMMSRILGASSPAALEHAKHLGMAMQMTNIARDVAEDWDRGRVYLPRQWFSPTYSASTNSLEVGTGNFCKRPTNEDIREPIERLLLLADRYYLSGKHGLSYLPVNVRWSIRVAADVYREIGVVIRQQDYGVMHCRHFVPTGRKCALVLRACWLELKNRLGVRSKVSVTQSSIGV